MRPSCTKCNKEMEQTRTGVAVGLVVGVKSSEASLYQVWSGDEFTCTDCGATVVCRFAEQPMWERFHTTPKPTVDVMVLGK